jgi:hypothetical protein
MEYSIFSSKNNESYIESYPSEDYDSFIKYELERDYIPEIVSVKRTHWNVLSFRWVDGTISYTVITPVKGIEITGGQVRM